MPLIEDLWDVLTAEIGFTYEDYGSFIELYYPVISTDYTRLENLDFSTNIFENYQNLFNQLSEKSGTTKLHLKQTSLKKITEANYSTKEVFAKLLSKKFETYEKSLNIPPINMYDQLICNGSMLQPSSEPNHNNEIKIFQCQHLNNLLKFSSQFDSLQ